MTSLDSLLNSLKISAGKENSNYSESKMFDSNSGGFSNVLESANKSYNFTYEKVSETPIQYNSLTYNEEAESFAKNFETENNQTNDFKFNESKFENNKEPIQKTIQEEVAYKKEEVNEPALEQKPVEENADSNKNEVKENKEEIKESKEEANKGKNEDSEKEQIKENNKPSEETDKKQKANVQTQDPEKVLANNSKKTTDNKNTNEQIVATLHIQSVKTEKQVTVPENAVENQTNKKETKGLQQTQEVVAANDVIKAKTTIKETASPVTQSAQENVKKQTATAQNTQELQKQQKASEQKQPDELNVAVKVEVLKDNKLENTNIEKDLKTKADISQDLRPVVTKLKVEADAGKQNQQQANQNNQNKADINLKTSTPQLINIESHVTKINLEKTSQFDKVLNQTQQKTQVNESKVLDQVTKNTAESIKQNKTQINIAITPERLGKVNVNIVSQKGELTAQLTAETKEAKDILTKGLETLKQNLQEQGVNVNNISVRVQEPAPSEQNFEQDLANKFQQSQENTANSNSSSKNGKNTNQAGTSDNDVEHDEAGLAESSEESEKVHDGVVDYTV